MMMKRNAATRLPADCILAVLLVLMTVLPTVRAEDLNEFLDKKVHPVQNEAIALKSEGKYEQAASKCKEAVTALSSFRGAENSALAKETAAMLTSLQKDITREWSDSLITEAQKELDAAQKLIGTDKQGEIESHCAKARTLAEKAMQIDAAGKDKGASMIQLAGDCIKASRDANTTFNAVVAAERKRQIALLEKTLSTDGKPYGRIAQIKTDINTGTLESLKKADEECAALLRELDRLAVSDLQKELKRQEVIHLKSLARRGIARDYITRARKEYFAAMEQAQNDPSRSTVLANAALHLIDESRRGVPEEGISELKAIEDGCNVLLKSNKYRMETSLVAVDPESGYKKEIIRTLLREGEAFYNSGLYGKSRDSLEQVIVQDPYNERALMMLARIYQKISKVAALRRDNEMLERMNELEWKWNQAPLPRDSSEAEEVVPTEHVEAENAEILKKLAKIRIPNIDAQDGNVGEVIRELREMSKTYDPSSEGINISYIPPADEPRLTLKLANVPIGVVLKYICDITGLSYNIGPDGVQIGGSPKITTRHFKMSQSRYGAICKEIAAIAGGGGGGDMEGMPGGMSDVPAAAPAPKAAGGGGGGGGGGGKDNNPLGGLTDDPFGGNGGAASSPETATNAQLKDYFKSMGIRFDSPQSSITYDSNTSELIVTNTPEILDEVGALLKEIDTPIPLILIEAKIVEITITDLEELGFDWTLTHINQNPRWMTASGVAGNSFLPGNDLFTLGGTGGAISEKLLRHTDGANGYTTDSSSGVGFPMIQGLNILPNFGSDGAWNLSVDIYAIDRSQRGEVLQAPKVIAYNGAPATITYAERRYFPESWNEPEVESSSGNSYLYTPSYPEFGDGEDYGTKFWVLPRVGANNATINLTLKPVINAQTDWTTYDYQIKVGSFSSGQGYDAMIKMPVISERSLDTQLKVYDGETVILGGILSEKTYRNEDKYPFLGDVPLLGRLFANRSKSGTKVNLLIFVTARIMGLDGVPHATNTDNGLFEFYR